MLRFSSVFAILLVTVAPAHAERWVQADATLWVDVDSMFTTDGYTLFKTKGVDSKGAIVYQHKEAIHCANKKHYFRGMYDAKAVVNNRNDADVRWTDWKTNPREVWDIDQLYALKNLVCSQPKR